MYSTCLFCDASFGTNSEIEPLPIGRRIAFDPAVGRLWVVCLRCGRWNLTPLEERWEANELAEKRFGATRIRISSENIGLARLPDGLELIRIGRPQRPEFAAWRYGREFLHRRYRRVLHTAGGYGKFTVAAVPLVAAAFGPLALLGSSAAAAWAAWALWRTTALRIGFEGGEELRLNLQQIHGTALVRDDSAPEGWALLLEHLPEPRSVRTLRLKKRFETRTARLTGFEARQVAAMVLPRVNSLGGNAHTVNDAAQWLTAGGGPERVFETIARSHHIRPPLDALQTTLASMHPGVRLALEMALHEDEERKALAGELSLLEWAWRREERLAAIADKLGLPEPVEHRLEEMKRGYL